jgi:putative hydroxymethylpyrimidine transport system ATP-binding protein
MSENILHFHNVTFSYPGEEKAIVQNLNFSIRNGEFVSVIGPSGCGKSTLFRLIAGLEQASSGEVTIQGKEAGKQANKVGYMPQQDLLLPWRTVLENAALPLECQGIKKRDAYAQVTNLIEKFGLKGYEHKYPKDLSGGMKQRVSFLRAILTGADVLLLDEPFSALDAITKVKMQEWLYEQWKIWKKTILFITHDVEEAIYLSNRILVITEQPIKNVTEIHVPLGGNRTRHQVYDEQLMLLKGKLIEQLKGKTTI